MKKKLNKIARDTNFYLKNFLFVFQHIFFMRGWAGGGSGRVASFLFIFQGSHYAVNFLYLLPFFTVDSFITK